MNIIVKKLTDITPYENNPRRNDEAVKYVAESIRQFGFKVPLIVDQNGIIIAGHTRYKAAIKLGIKEVPCIIADDLTEEQIKAFRLADNKVSEIAEWDMELLEIELDDITFDMGDFGFDEIQYEDEPVKEQKEVKLGADNYQIIIDCESEYDCEIKYNQLLEMGIECRISTL